MDRQRTGFDSQAFERLARQMFVDTDSDSDSDTLPVVDLRPFTFLTIGGLNKLIALLYTILWDSRRQLAPVPIRLPTEPAAMRFLHKMQFFTLLSHDDVIAKAHELARFDDHAMQSGRYPYLSFRRLLAHEMSAADFTYTQHRMIEDLIQTFERALVDELGYSRSDTSDFWQLNSELLQNIHMHSGSWGYTVIQCTRHGATLSYGDLGVGFRASLQCIAERVTSRSNGIWDDCTAIITGFERGITGAPGRGFGLGLHRVREFASKKGGVIECRSGGGRVIFHPTGRLSQFAVPELVGVQLNIHLPKGGT